MLRQDGVCTGERRDRPGDPRDACASAARERHTLDGAIEQRRCGLGAPKHVAVAQPLTGGDDPRPAPRAEASPGGAASSSARGRGIATTRSKRSSSARETFSR